MTISDGDLVNPIVDCDILDGQQARSHPRRVVEYVHGHRCARSDVHGTPPARGRAVSAALAAEMATDTCLHKYEYIYIYICVYIYTYIYEYIYIYIYI